MESNWSSGTYVDHVDMMLAGQGQLERALQPLAPGGGNLAPGCADPGHAGKSAAAAAAAEEGAPVLNLAVIMSDGLITGAFLSSAVRPAAALFHRTPHTTAIRFA
jgi:hypothetical protein